MYAVDVQKPNSRSTTRFTCQILNYVCFILRHPSKLPTGKRSDIPFSVYTVFTAVSLTEDNKQMKNMRKKRKFTKALILGGGWAGT